MKHTLRLTCLTGILLSLLFTTSAVAQPPAFSPLAPDAGCSSGSGYDPACDVTHDGDIDITDIQRTAGHWNSHGVWTSDHDHWGESWSGSGTGLTLQSSGPSQGTFGGSFTGYGGVYAAGTGYNGPGIEAISTDDFGGKFTSTNYVGVQVSAARTGIKVTTVGDDGLYVELAGDHGVRVAGANNYGVHTNGGTDSSSDYGGYFAGYNGVQGVATGASGYGASFQSAHADAVRVPSADVDGVSVQSAGADGLYVKYAGNDGLDIDEAVQDGVDIQKAGSVGVRIVDGGAIHFRYVTDLLRF